MQNIRIIILLSYSQIVQKLAINTLLIFYFLTKQLIQKSVKFSNNILYIIILKNLIIFLMTYW